MVTYAPYFISTVVVVSMIMIFLDPSVGIVNNAIGLFGGETVRFMERPDMFRSIFVVSNIWQGAGWSTIIYLAALSGVSTELHEAAIADGASKVKRIWHIDLPGIIPTIVIMLILRSGQILNIGFERVLLMQNPLNLPVSNIIATHVYEMGVAGILPLPDYATAIGLFNSVINFVILFGVNIIAKRVSETSLW